MFNKVFNIGLPKTGTASLYEALNILGLKTLHNPREFREKSLRGEYQYDDPDWQAVCNLSEHYYPQLDKAYAGSKFILTIRDVNSWLKSLEKQYGDSEGDEALPLLRGRVAWYSSTAMKRLLLRILGKEQKNINMLGRVQVFGTYKFSRERCAFVYQLHYKNALEYFKDRPNDLLIMDITAGDGWEKLCPFLGIREIPKISFPHRIPQPLIKK
jgi:hypothetical protein